MKINSKILYIFSALFVLAIVISSAGAVDDLISNQFDNESFVIDVPSGSDFSKEATTKLNVGDVAMDMSVYNNKGNNSDDVNTILYLKDSSSDKKIATDLINDLEKDGKIIEENDNYVVVETGNSNWNFLNFDVGDGLNDLWGFFNGFFSFDVENVVPGDLEVSEENSTVSLSSDGLKVSTVEGDNVSISSDGVKVWEGNESSSDDNESADVDVSVNGEVADVQDGNYAIYLKNQNADQIIVITGNNLELMKAMADTASFTEN